MPARSAVVIGTNYIDPLPVSVLLGTANVIPSLRYAEADARAVAAILEAEGFAVTSLIGPDATRVEIIKALRAHSKANIGLDDVRVVYFSGHGGLDPDVPDLAYL